jgi:exodeoxyribonuclease VII large subunit
VAGALQRRAAAASGPDAAGRRAALESLTLALAAHDPERVVERGYTVVDDRAGNVITSAEAARAAGGVRLFFADAAVDATVSQEEHKERE